MIEQPQHWTAYVNAWSTFAAAAAAIAVAIFAFVEIRRAQDGERSRRRVADSRVSGEAYKLRREISSWGLDYPPKEAGTEAAISWWVNRPFERLDQRFAAMLGLAVESSEHVSAAIKEAYIHFYKVTEETAHARIAWDEKRPGSSTHIEAARKETNACRASLAKAIDRDLLPQFSEGRIPSGPLTDQPLPGESPC